MNLATAFLRAGRYEDALGVGRRLESECGEAESVRHCRILVHLNQRDWRLALDAAGSGHDAVDALLASLAAVELGEEAVARAKLVEAILGAPETVAVLFGYRDKSKPDGYRAVESQNMGVELHASLTRYLSVRSGRSKRLARQLWQHPVVTDLRQEVRALEREWTAERDQDRRTLERLERIRSRSFAEETAARLEQQPTNGRRK